MDVAGDEVTKGILKTAPQAIPMEISKANGSTELEIAENAARSGSKVTTMASRSGVLISRRKRAYQVEWSPRPESRAAVAEGGDELPSYGL